MPQVIESRTFRTESGYWVCEIPSKDPFLMPSQFAFFRRKGIAKEVSHVGLTAYTPIETHEKRYARIVRPQGWLTHQGDRAMKIE